MLRELRTVIPAFLTRVDRADRGVAPRATTWPRAERTAAELAAAPGACEPARRRRARRAPDRLRPRRRGARAGPRPVAGERGRPGRRAQPRGRGSSPGRRAEALRRVGRRRGADRRQRPGRALEATTYTFEVVCDYGAYRDLQRHRMLTLQAQPLDAAARLRVPDEVAAAGAADDYAAIQAALRRPPRRAGAGAPRPRPPTPSRWPTASASR